MLDRSNNLVRAASGGVEASPQIYAADQDVIEPLVERLRLDMAAASHGLSDSTDAITGLGVQELITLSEGTAAIVSVRPVVPDTNAVRQRPGYLHVSLRLLVDQTLVDAIAENFEIAGLRFDAALDNDLDRMSSAVLDTKGRIIEFFSWLPGEAAYQLLQETAPIARLVLASGGSILLFLINRLRRTSSMLEHSEAEATFLAFHDPLTGTPNRALFEDRLEQALAICAAPVENWRCIISTPTDSSM